MVKWKFYSLSYILRINLKEICIFFEPLVRLYPLKSNPVWHLIYRTDCVCLLCVCVNFPDINYCRLRSSHFLNSLSHCIVFITPNATAIVHLRLLRTSPKPSSSTTSLLVAATSNENGSGFRTKPDGQKGFFGPILLKTWTQLCPTKGELCFIGLYDELLVTSLQH